MRRALVVGGLAAGLVVALAPAASAHPLGNFTVNTADRVLVGQDGVRVVHAVDSAEIPTLQLLQQAAGPDTDRDGTATAAELSSWAAAECARLGPSLSLVVDGTGAPLTVTASAARTLPGQAGLATSRLDCTYDSGVPARSTVAFSDPTSAGRTGWKEVSASALCGTLTGTDGLPAESPSGLLSAYPEDLLASPLDVTAASFGIGPGGTCRLEGSSAPAPSTVLPRGVDQLTSSYTAFVSRQDLTLPVALLAVLLSIALGCGHAVAPGHGKTVIAAYLVGQRGTKRQALWLGATVTATHTAGVLLLGALLSLTSVAAPERFVPATEIASGLLLGAVGVFLLRRSWHNRGPHDHRHGHHRAHHDDHAHDHDDEPHAHQHAPTPLPIRQRTLVGSAGPAATVPHQPDQAERDPALHAHTSRVHRHAHLPATPLGWRTLATMGIAGGLVPSPSALVVLLGASALGRPIFGAVLVVGYGLGMAMTLTLAGLLLLHARTRLDTGRWAAGRPAQLARALPTLTATVVLLVGTLVLLRGVLTLRGLG